MNPFLFSFQSPSPYQHLLHADPCIFTCILNTAGSSPVFAGSFWYTYILFYYFVQLIIMDEVKPLGTLALALEHRTSHVGTPVVPPLGLPFASPPQLPFWVFVAAAACGISDWWPGPARWWVWGPILWPRWLLTSLPILCNIHSFVFYLYCRCS